jgi:TolB-like protein/Tfp pilus assembly protein PilF
VSRDSSAVFVSYASEDAEAAQRIAGALEAAGIRVWFDRSELRGGDEWDRRIRDQIRACRLFVPILSETSERRDEGYFRREWALAVERTRDMAHHRAFLVPVAIDATGERAVSVPDKFREYQWTRLPGGDTPPAFVERIRHLLEGGTPGDAPPAGSDSPSARAPTGPARRAARFVLWGGAAVVLAGLAGVAYVRGRPATAPHPDDPVPAADDRAAPGRGAARPKSIAVLPFADMSEKHDEEYFSDGLTEELIDRLAQSPNLTVIARTSSFQFKGRSDDVRAIGKKLGVANLIEGSVRRSGKHLRISIQLLRAEDGALAWSKSYDREEADALRLQDEIATEVAGSLAVSLTRSGPTTPTMTPAYALYLRAREILERDNTEDGNRQCIALLEQAVALDPQLATAWAYLAWARLALALDFPERFDRALAIKNARRELERAQALGPTLLETHVAAARIALFVDWDGPNAQREIDRALELGAGQANVQRNAVYVAEARGQWDQAVAHAKRAAELDPLSPWNHARLGDAWTNLGNFSEATAAYQTALAMQPTLGLIRGRLSRSLWFQGRRSEAVEAAEHEISTPLRLECQVFMYAELGRREDSRRALETLIRSYGTVSPTLVAVAFIDVGDLDSAFAWWQRAVTARDPDALFLLSWARDPQAVRFRADPRYTSLVRQLRLGNS